MRARVNADACSLARRVPTMVTPGARGITPRTKSTGGGSGMLPDPAARSSDGGYEGSPGARINERTP